MTTDTERKEVMNNATRRSCLPGAREVLVRHCDETVSLSAGEHFGSVCHIIHPDVTLKEFFK